MAYAISPRLQSACRRTAATRQWLAQLPTTIGDLAQRWQLTLGAPFDSEDTTCAWVAPATRADGTRAVLKLAMPHFEGRDEIAGLRFWSGDPTVRLLAADDARGAMLLERCEPGTSLRTIPESEQDVVIAQLLRRIWRPPPAEPFRPLSAMLACWAEETRSRRALWRDPALVEEGLRLFDALASDSPADHLLATDLHAGNVLRAARQPWLVIDPKPFVGDPAYDATQHLLNGPARLHADPDGTIRRFAELLQLDHARVRLWTFARIAAEWCSESPHAGAELLARRLAP